MHGVRRKLRAAMTSGRTNSGATGSAMPSSARRRTAFSVANNLRIRRAGLASAAVTVASHRARRPAVAALRPKSRLHGLPRRRSRRNAGFRPSFKAGARRQRISMSSGHPYRAPSQAPRCRSRPVPVLCRQKTVGGGGRTRTYEGVSQRIYSPPPLPLGTLPRTAHSVSGGVRNAIIRLVRMRVARAVFIMSGRRGVNRATSA